MKSFQKSSLAIRSAVVAALGGLLFGFDTAVISGTTESLKSVFSLSDLWLGFTVSSALFGTILGAATIQIPTNRWGRKKTLLAIAVLYFVSAVGSAFPWDWSSFLFFRFIGGIAVGGASVVSPLYTTEISPPKIRGFLVAVTQFNIVFGILLAYMSNFAIAGGGFGDDAWRVMFGVEAIPAAIFFCLLFLNPESPRWLLTKNRTDEARNVLTRLLPDSEAVEEEIRVVQKALNDERADGRETFFCRKYRFPIFLAIMIAAFNQLSGINAILYYAPKVFLMAGASAKAALFLPMIIGLTNLVFTMAAMGVIDSFGRKKLMYVGSVGYIVSLAVVGTAFLIYQDEFAAQIQKIEAATQAVASSPNDDSSNASDGVSTNVADNAGNLERTDASVAESATAAITASQTGAQATGATVSPTSSSEVPRSGILTVLIGLMVFIAAHAFGQGACIWVFISEIFPNAVRAQGQALGSFVHWILAAVVSGFFPATLTLLGPANVFFVFAGFMVLQLLWVAFAMPETKQIPLEEMQKKLGITKSA